MKLELRMLLLLALTSPAAAQVQLTPDDKAALAACDAVKSLRLPVVAPRNAADQKHLESCVAEDLYYGVKREDFAEARRCAAYQLQHPGEASKGQDEDPFEYATLAMVYGNGRGTPRNIDLGIRAACLSFGGDVAAAAPDVTVNTPDRETEQTIIALVALKADHSGKVFDFCSDVGHWKDVEAECAATTQAVAQRHRDERIAALMTSWTPAQRAAYHVFRTAFASYREAVVEHEGEACITGTWSEELELEEAVNRDLEQQLEGSEQGKLPSFSHQQALDADHDLNVLYGQLMTKLKAKDGEFCEISSTSLRDSERGWLVYRDAWVKFARVRWPQVSADSWLAKLSRERIDWLGQSVFGEP